jgi:hypothetical protein
MIRSHLSLALTVLMICSGSADAASQKVFRCGPDGRVYSQTPCKDGYEVNADDARSAEQRKAAEEQLKRDAKLNEKMARERRAREAAAQPAIGVIVNPAAARPAPSPASGAATKKKPQAKPKPLQP